MEASYPITKTHDLDGALPFFNMPLTVLTRDGARWQLDGIKMLVEENGGRIFALCVGPVVQQSEDSKP